MGIGAGLARIGGGFRVGAWAGLVLAGVSLIAGLVLAQPPIVPLTPPADLLPTAIPAIAHLLPFVGGLLAILAGIAALMARTAPTRADVPSVTVTAAPDPESLSVIADLRALLADERRELSAFRDSCRTASQEAMIVGARLAEVALDAETRLSGSIDQAEQALTRPSSAIARAAEATLRVERALPELAEMLRDNLAQRPTSVAPTAADSATAGQFAAIADQAAQMIGAAASGAAAQIAALGELATVLRRDAVALDTAGREIAAAGAGVVSRMGEAVSHVDAALARFPSAAEALGVAVEQVVQNLAEASAVLAADSAALDASGRETLQAANVLQDEAAALRGAGEDAARGGAVAAGRIAEAAAAITASLEDLAPLTTTLSATTEALRGAASGLETAGGRIDEQLAAEARRSEEAHSVLPAITATLETAATALGEHAYRLGSVGHEIAEAARDASGHLAIATKDLRTAIGDVPPLAETLAAGVAALQQEATDLASIGAQIVENGASLRAQAESDAARIRDSIAAMPDTAATFEQMASDLRQETSALSAAAARVADMGAQNLHNVTTTFAKLSDSVFEGAEALRSDADALHLASVQAAQGMATLQMEAEALNAAAAAFSERGSQAVAQVCDHAEAATHQIRVASSEATASLTDAVARLGETSGALGSAGRMMAGSSEDVAVQIGRLAGIAGHAETQAALLPAWADQIAAAAGRLEAMTGAMQPEAATPGLAEALARMEAAAPDLARLDAISRRLETMANALSEGVSVAGSHPELPAQRDPAISEVLAALAALSAETGETMRMLETAVDRCDGAGERLAQSIIHVQEAAMAVARAAMPSALPGEEEAPSAISATIRHLGGVEREAEALLLQAEALAQAVLSGEAIALPDQLAERAPSLLAGVETTIRRLRSAATALALASDGQARPGGRKRVA